MQPAQPLPPERRDDLQADLDLSIVIPCLNEVKTLPAVIARASRTIDRLGLRGEVLVSDNGSVDGAIESSELLGARVLHCPERGYGNALRYGMTYARGRWLIMGDADDTYNFEEIDPFIAELGKGSDFVMGTRLPPGHMKPGANPWLNRRIGTPSSRSYSTACSVPVSATRTVACAH